MMGAILYREKLKVNTLFFLNRASKFRLTAWKLHYLVLKSLPFIPGFISLKCYVPFDRCLSLSP